MMPRTRTFDDARPAGETRRERALYALTGGRVGRRRKPDPPVVGGPSCLESGGESVQVPAGFAGSERRWARSPARLAHW